MAESKDGYSTSDFLGAGIDPSKLHPLAGLGNALDYLSVEDAQVNTLPGSQTALPSRGWSDDLCYGTGTTYVTALGLGGAWGLIEGLRRPLDSDSFKLRLNSILNSCTRRGPFLGNSAAVVAMMYNGLNSFIGYQRGVHDGWNSVAAGGLAGLIFKSTAGVKQAAIAGTATAGIAGAWTYLKNSI